MPNIENIKLAITVMERVKKNEEELGRQLFDLRMFQGGLNGVLVPLTKTEEETLNHCGAVCCFAGWLAVSPEFRAMGYGFDIGGTPRLSNLDVETSLERLIGLDTETVMGIVYNRGNGDLYYGKPTKDVTVDDVIGKLKALIGEG